MNHPTGRAAAERGAMASAPAIARHARSLRLADALVLATAEGLGADSVLTTDASWADAGQAPGQSRCSR